MDTITQLAELLAAAEKAVVLSGAGISTESNLPDYRGTSGLWKDKRLAEIANIKTYHSDPESLWQFYEQRLEGFRGAEPNRGHMGVAELVRRGIVKGVITQNIDGLHAAAGTEAAEVHGSIRESVCPACKSRYPMSVALDQLVATSHRPLCPSCGSVLKPGVILFGEMLPEEAEQKAYALLRGCDLLLVLGSSLRVIPVANYPAAVIEQAGKIAIVNLGATIWDDEATVLIDAGIGATLTHVLAEPSLA